MDRNPRCQPLTLETSQAPIPPIPNSDEARLRAELYAARDEVRSLQRDLAAAAGALDVFLLRSEFILFEIYDICFQYVVMFWVQSGIMTFYIGIDVREDQGKEES